MLPNKVVKCIWLFALYLAVTACRSETVTSPQSVAPSNKVTQSPVAPPVNEGVPSQTTNVAPADPKVGELTTGRDDDLEWVERVVGGGDSDAPLPMIIAVHGLGDKPEVFIRVFEGLTFPARVIAPRAPNRYGNGYSWFDIGAQTLSDSAMINGLDEAAETVTLWAARMIRKRPTVGKPILTGFSQGGMIAFAAVARHPALYQAVYPISGLLPSMLWPKTVDDRSVLPKIRAFHGEADTRVPYTEAQRTVAQLSAVGYDAVLRGYPDVPHRLTAVMWRDLVSELRTHAGVTGGETTPLPSR